jgi:histidinol phosphatase-like PHP family hydrolase
MRPLFDHHIHSTRSDGTVSLEDRARSVAERPHGISDHYPWPTGMRADDDILRYLDDAARLGLRVGIEYDLGVAPPLRRTTRDALDYVIGSVHQIPGELSYGVAGQFLKGRGGPVYSERERFSDPALQRRILERHLALVREGILDTGIDIVGHPTLSPLAALGDPEAAYPVEWQERLIELCVAHGVALELNEAYGVPHRELLVRAHARGARFAVGSDTHFALLPLDRTAAMIAAAALPTAPFLDGRRPVRPGEPDQAGVSTVTSS